MRTGGMQRENGNDGKKAQEFSQLMKREFQVSRSTFNIPVLVHRWETKPD